MKSKIDTRVIRKTPTCFEDLQTAYEIYVVGVDSLVKEFHPLNAHSAVVRKVNTSELKAASFSNLIVLSFGDSSVHTTSKFDKTLDSSKVVGVFVNDSPDAKVIEWFISESVDNAIILMFEDRDGDYFTDIYFPHELKMIIVRD